MSDQSQADQGGELEPRSHDFEHGILCIDVYSSMRDGISINEASSLLWDLLPHCRSWVNKEDYTIHHSTGIGDEHIRRLCRRGKLKAHQDDFGWWWIDPDALVAHARSLGGDITMADLVREHCKYIRRGRLFRVDPDNYFLPAERGYFKRD